MAGEEFSVARKHDRSCDHVVTKDMKRQKKNTKTDYRGSVEQEEEDIDRIKEQSRNRRRAILEKYKKLNLQHEVLPQSDHDAAQMEDEKASLPIGKLPGRHSSLASGVDSPDVDGDDPIFSVGESPVRNINNQKDKENSLQVKITEPNDNFVKEDGRYKILTGEILGNRYEVIKAHGEGVYSNVVHAKDLEAGKNDPKEVAIKILLNNNVMYKAGQEEAIILKTLADADREDRMHCVRILSTFKHRKHLCLVLESLHMNLREVLDSYGRNIGLNLTAVRAYAKQLFISLKHLKECRVLHCDIKPENVMVNKAKNDLKLCDFGTSMFAGGNEITPYLVSRFYRAPEVILGLPYDHPLDIWSVGCSLYELHSGKVLFPGQSNSDMLRLHMELKGPFPKKMLRKGAFANQHFDQVQNFHAIKRKSISTIVTGSYGEDRKMLADFKDLLERTLVLDPDKRITASQALAHPFILGQNKRH